MINKSLLQSAKDIINNKIVPLFAKHNIDLNYVPVAGGTIETWRYINNSSFIILMTGIVNNNVTIFGEYYSKNGDNFELTSPAEKWVDYFSEYIPAIISGNNIKL